jgi:imidazole glycerol-phosphate synthase subunit HisH
MIGVLDYGMGNLRSVTNAIEYIGFDAHLISVPSDLKQITHLILPGVGSYSQAMKNLKESGLIEVIQNHIDSGKPFLGICLGMQILASKGFEHGETDGMGIIDGKVTPFELRREFLVPHMGWNTMKLQRSHPLFEGMKPHIDYYFVHSFHFQTEKDENILAVTNYESNFNSVVVKENVVGVQFHPEKSQESGLKILENFCDWNGKC